MDWNKISRATTSNFQLFELINSAIHLQRASPGIRTNLKAARKVLRTLSSSLKSAVGYIDPYFATRDNAVHLAGAIDNVFKMGENLEATFEKENVLHSRLPKFANSSLLKKGVRGRYKNWHEGWYVHELSNLFERHWDELARFLATDCPPEPVLSFPPMPSFLNALWKKQEATVKQESKDLKVRRKLQLKLFSKSLQKRNADFLKFCDDNHFSSKIARSKPRLTGQRKSKK
jgi:hypothetical protein